MGQTMSEVVLHQFRSPPKGAYPKAGVIRDAAGNLYGTTELGGAANAGAVYKVDTRGRITVLYSFKGGEDGASPLSGVIADPVGNLYGTTYFGGTNGWGTVYKLDTSGNHTVLHHFLGLDDGMWPVAGVIRDADGNLYGTTQYGGSISSGVVYKLDPEGHETILHNFTGGVNGGQITAGVIRDASGNFYGTSKIGGSAKRGFVYKIDSAGHMTVLYTFMGQADGGDPSSGVIRDGAGNLYGTATSGGTGNGVVYRLSRTGIYTVLYAFGNEAVGPDTSLFRDTTGNLYGTCRGGGSGNNGVVYKLDPAGNLTILYNFPTHDPSFDKSNVIRDSTGSLYGTTRFGGPVNLGQIYKLDGGTQEITWYAFPPNTDGAYPMSGVIRDPAGTFYGTTSSGGTSNLGTVYRLDVTGRLTVMHSFAGGADGKLPYSGVIRDPAGNLYGTTYNGGPADAGVVYTIDANGQERVLYSFSGGNDGAYPRGTLVRDSAGNLYGTTELGGAAGAGVVFRLDPNGIETVLHSFSYDRGLPRSGVIRDSAGNLYGTTYGTVYKLDPTGNLTTLHDFGENDDGYDLWSSLTSDSVGNLYGTTLNGGRWNTGTVFKLNPGGSYTVLYTFTGDVDGGSPYAGVIRDTAGNLYGTTYDGGSRGKGVAYKLDPAGKLTVLYHFTGTDGGGGSQAGLTGDPAGNLYGTTYYGGGGGGGVIFQLKRQ